MEAAVANNSQTREAEAFAPGSACWIKADDADRVFERASVVKHVYGRGFEVQTAVGATKTLRAVELAPANPEDMIVPDVCQLLHVNESTILENLRLRFERGDIYTFTGTILNAVNPFREVPRLYGEAAMASFQGRALSAQEPHVYAMAEEAFRCLCQTRQPQALVVSGESGAGKTETNKHLMYYLTWRAAQAHAASADLSQALLQANPVLEAFGNARTARNDNSSRFGKFVRIGFAPSGAIRGAATLQLLLEKVRVVRRSDLAQLLRRSPCIFPVQVRVVRHAAAERSFHIFYQLLAAAAKQDEPRLCALGVAAPAAAFGCLVPSAPSASSEASSAASREPAAGDAALDAARYEETAAALAAIGVSAEEVEAGLRLVAGLLHLSNVMLVGDEAAAVCAEARPALSRAAELCGLAGLEECVLRRTVSTGRESTPAGGRCRPLCFTTAPHLPAWGLPRRMTLRRTPERRQHPPLSTTRHPCAAACRAGAARKRGHGQGLLQQALRVGRRARQP